MMSDVVKKAFAAWQETFPGHRKGLQTHTCRGVDRLLGKMFKIPPNWDGSCNCPGGSAFHVIWFVNQYGWREYKSRPDNEVCERERRWRRYFQLRDFEEQKMAAVVQNQNLN